MANRLQDYAMRGAWDEFEKHLERITGPALPFPVGTWVYVVVPHTQCLDRIVGRLKGANHTWLFLEKAAYIGAIILSDGHHRILDPELPEEHLALNRDHIRSVCPTTKPPEWA